MSDRPRTWVAVASAITILLATAVPALFGPVTYDALVAVNVVMAIAVIATAVYAAANLSAFRAAKEAEYTPVLDLRLQTVRERGLEKHLFLEVRNIGRGVAAGLEVAVWQTDKDLVMWFPERVALECDVLRSGETASGRIDFEWVHPLAQRHLQPGLPTTIVQVKYRSALLKDEEAFYPFELPSGEDEAADMSRLRPSPFEVPKELTSVDAKQRLLDQVLAHAAEEAGLTALGLKVVGTVTRRAQSMRVLDGDAVLWSAEIGRNEGVYHLAEWLQGSAEELKASQSEHAKALEASAPGSSPAAEADKSE